MNIRSFFPARYHVHDNVHDLPVHLRQEERQTLSLVDLALIEQAVQRDEAALRQQVLSAAEQRYFQRFKYIKRKKEWLGGRIAAKAAILASFPAADQDLCTITILPDKHGRPVVEELPACFSGRKSRPVISLSHSDGFAAALAREEQKEGARAKSSCGIDLQ
ncbi:MAG: hypothetical protein D3914_14415, partial [Candidatus Electrothrix sp. LOE2]|nr:hypothetical protein [Candidatus Electrothrix sp. LOE2]